MSRWNPYFYAAAVVFLGLLLHPPALPGQSGPPPLDVAAQQRAVADLAQKLRDSYVFPEVAERTARHLDAQLKSGAYGKLTDPRDFAQALTRDLQEITKDKHLRVGMRPPRPQGQAPPDPAARRAEMARAMRRDNYGFARLERLPGNVGYLDLRGFVPAEIEDAGATAAAAMSFLANSDAVIIDLRQNGGGAPSMIQLISSYFFERPTHLNSLYWRAGDRTDQFWTLPHVPGRKMPDTPLFVLTSSQTFSAAEEFANNLKALGRARIVGETTGGGANPGATFEIEPVFTAFIPTGRAINPITETNWEGVGVEPDEKVAAAEALDVAHMRALEAVAARSQDARQKQQVEWALAGLAARRAPPQLPAEKLSRFAGKYGARLVTFEGGALHYQREGRAKLRLLPMSEDTFMVEGLEHFRVRFENDGSGRVARLVGLYDNGQQEASAREN